MPSFDCGGEGCSNPAGFCLTCDAKRGCAEKTRADDLSRTVAAMGALLVEAHEDLVREEERHAKTGDGLDTTDVTHTLRRGVELASRPDVTAERGRWRPRLEANMEIGRAKARAIEAEQARDAAIARAENLDARLRDRCEDLVRVGNMNVWSSNRADAAERARDELGIQLAAQSERLRLAMACVKAGDFVINDSRVKVPGVYAYFEARAALDAIRARKVGG